MTSHPQDAFCQVAPAVTGFFCLKALLKTEIDPDRFNETYSYLKGTDGMCHSFLARSDQRTIKECDRTTVTICTAK